MLWPVHKLTHWAGKGELVPEGWRCQSGARKGKMLREKVLRRYDVWGQRHSLPLESFWCVVVWVLTDTVTEDYIIFMKPSIFPWLSSLLSRMFGFRESQRWILSHQRRSWSSWCPPPHMALVVDSDLRLSLGSGIMWLDNIVNVWNISESKSWIVQCRQ